MFNKIKNKKNTQSRNNVVVDFVTLLTVVFYSK